MIAVELNPERLLALAEQLRKTIPTASSAAHLAMTDAAGELQRIADQLLLARKESRRVSEAIAGVIVGAIIGGGDCQCPICTARRAAQAQQQRSLN